jgi:hypothetical protein
MSFDPHSNRFDSHSHRFDLRRPFPAIENDEEEMFETPDTCRRSSDEDWTNDPPERDFDLALEQIASERCCVCPLCGAIVGSDGTVLSK